MSLLVLGYDCKDFRFGAGAGEWGREEPWRDQLRRETEVPKALWWDSSMGAVIEV